MRYLLNDEKVRYILAGGTAAAINWLARFPLSGFMSFPLAVAVATMIGMVFGFLSYKYLVFGPTQRRLLLQIRDFIGVNLFAALFTIGVAVALKNLLPWPGDWSWFVEPGAHAAGIATGAGVNYLGHRHVTFNNRQG